jgi:hypothetical protein
MSTAGANSGQSLLLGGMGAAKTTQAAALDPFATALMGIGSSPALVNKISGMFGGAGNAADYDWSAGNVNNATSSYWR